MKSFNPCNKSFLFIGVLVAALVVSLTPIGARADIEEIIAEIIPTTDNYYNRVTSF